MKRSLQQQILICYCLIFYGLLLYKLANGMLLSQLQPLFLYNTFDLFTWFFLQTHIPQWLLHSKQFLLLDVCYYSAPLLLLCMSVVKPTLSFFATVYLLFINWIYLQCYSLFPASSITIYITGFLFPVLFLAKQKATFLLLRDALRYFFIYFFVSAALWKIVQGGVFNPVQMSAILLEQHKELLTNSPGYWITHLYEWLIRNSRVSYLLYVCAALMELSFIIGFFTKRFDNLFVFMYLLFLIADHLIMRIPYYETLPFLLTMDVRLFYLLRQKNRFFSNFVSL